MAEHASTFEILASQGGSNNAGMTNNLYRTQGAVVPALGGLGIRIPLPGTGANLGAAFPNVPLSGWNQIRAPLNKTPVFHAVIAIDTAGGPCYVTVNSEEDTVTVQGSGETNGAVVFPINPITTISDGRQSPTLEVELDGDAEAAVLAVGALSGTGNATVWLGYPRGMQYAGLMHFGEFTDIPPDSAADGTEKLGELISQISRAGAQFDLGATSGGGNILVNDCGFAAMAPEGVVFIDPADIGNANEQIPAAVGDNSAAHFRFHPSVFLRRTSYVRQVHRANLDPVAITTQLQGNQPFRIESVDADLDDSDWHIVVDGVGYNVRLNHSGVGGLRRPRDIWNQVWVPLLQGSQAASNAVQFLGLDGNTTGVGTVADKLRYLQYARMFGLGESGQSTPDFQTGTALPV